MNVYITITIYSASGSSHQGHAYTSLLADVYGWYLGFRRAKVLLLIGTDEHGQKIERTAAAKGIELSVFVDQIIQNFERLLRDLKVDVDIFQGTTDPAHEKPVRRFGRGSKRAVIFILATTLVVIVLSVSIILLRVLIVRPTELN